MNAARLPYWLGLRLTGTRDMSRSYLVTPADYVQLRKITNPLPVPAKSEFMAQRHEWAVVAGPSKSGARLVKVFKKTCLVSPFSLEFQGDCGKIGTLPISAYPKFSTIDYDLLLRW